MDDLCFTVCIFCGDDGSLCQNGDGEDTITSCYRFANHCGVAFHLGAGFFEGRTERVGVIVPEDPSFLFLSGISTGASWLFYFKAIQKGEVYKVAAIDKSSIVLTVLLAAVFLGEALTIWKGVGVLLIFLGTCCMMKKREVREAETGKGWLFYAILSVVFASLTAILGKIGIADVPSNLGTAIRTVFVLLMAWMIVFFTGEQKAMHKLDKSSVLFLTVSGMGTGLSWICYYKALQIGPASLVAPIDKLSLLVTALLAYFILKEKPSPRSILGLALILIGTLTMLIV